MKINRLKKKLNGNDINLEWIIDEGLIKLTVHSDTESLDKVKECFDSINKDLMNSLQNQKAYDGSLYQ